MKVEFNPDGSIKLPEGVGKKKEDDDKTFENEKCIKIVRDQISSVTPLKCELRILASEKVENPEKIESIFKHATGKFRHLADLSIKKINNREYVVTIISGQFRCTWCEQFREFIGTEMDAKVINWGSCFNYTPSREY